jgi:AcrR family transcriptional regulator
MIRRGRLRRFDVDWAISQALHEFWSHGYAGTTLTKLKAVMGGICSPSLYAAFGSKDRLFKRVLHLYLQEEILPALRILEADGPLAIRRFLRQTVIRLTQDGKPHGCLVEICLGNASGMGGDVALVLSDIRAQSSHVLLSHLDRMLLAGEISTRMDPLRLLQLISVMIAGLSSQAKEGATRVQLFAVVEDFLSCALPLAGMGRQCNGGPPEPAVRGQGAFLRPNLSSANI